jgi:hypothetical protein
MREFLFPHCQVWVLMDPDEVATTTMEGNQTLLVFSDEDLATTYSQKNGLLYTATLFRGPRLIGFLSKMKAIGVSHVAIDHTTGQADVFGATIEKVINNVARKAE